VLASNAASSRKRCRLDAVTFDAQPLQVREVIRAAASYLNDVVYLVLASVAATHAGLVPLCYLLAGLGGDGAAGHAFRSDPNSKSCEPSRACQTARRGLHSTPQ